MQQESSTAPHVWLLVSNAITAFVTFVTTLAAIWFKRKREPAEVAKIHAETRQIHTSSDVSFGGLTLETFKEIQQVIQKAEDRRLEWHQREEQLRGQVVHWRCKAEELDGQLIEVTEQNAQHETRAKLHEHQIKKLKALLSYHNISYAELDHPKE